MKGKETGRRAEGLSGSMEILLAAVIWGYGFTVTRDSLGSVTFYNLMTWRYAIAGMLLLLPFAGHLRKTDKRLLLEGAILGALLYVGQSLQTQALSYGDTTAGKVAFITALYIVIVPFLDRVVFRKRLGRIYVLAVGLAVLGLFCLTGAGSGFGKGDLLALLGSMGLSIHILAADRFTERHDALALTILQFIFAAVYADAAQMAAGEAFALNVKDIEILWPLIYLGVFSTMLGFLFQMSGQKRLPAELSALLLSTESVFGMAFSVLLSGEKLTLAKTAGCVLMLAGILLAERTQKGETTK